jgi:hypothetical protein
VEVKIYKALWFGRLGSGLYTMETDGDLVLLLNELARLRACAISNIMGDT